MALFSSAAAILTAGSLVAISGLHVYWCLGGVFPAKKREDLGPTVVGGPRGMKMPSAPITVLVAGLFLGAGIVPLVASGVVPFAAPAALVKVATLGMAGVFLARGLYGYVDRKLRPETVGTPFEMLNRRVYSPLCLALAVLTVASLSA